MARGLEDEIIVASESNPLLKEDGCNPFINDFKRFAIMSNSRCAGMVFSLIVAEKFATASR